MINNYAAYIQALAALLASFKQITTSGFKKQSDGNFRNFDLALADSFREALKAFMPSMQALRLELSHVYSQKLLNTWEHNGFNRVYENGMIEVLRGRVEDELGKVFFIYIPPDKAIIYNAPTTGWNEIITRFAEVTTDVEEMYRCFALSRYAAAVFHSVQTIEFGLIRLGQFLGVSDPKSGWTAVSGKLTILVTKTKYADLDPRYQQHHAFIEQIHGVIEALKYAWRNKISHAQGRLRLMTSEFSPEVTEEIIFATRSFMRRLATELPQLP